VIGAACFPVTRVYFISDDFLSMLTVVDRGGLLFLIQPFGAHMLIARNATLWLMYEMWGLDAGPSGWLVLLTHLVNAALLFRIARRSTGSTALASVATTMWAISPLQPEMIGWFANYGQVQAGTVMLFVLDRVLSRPPGNVPARMAALWSVLLWVGATCIGGGIAVAMVFPVLVALLVPDAVRQRSLVVAFGALPIAVVASYFGLRWLYAQFGVMSFFDLILLGSVESTLWMFLHLVRAGVTGVLHGGVLTTPAHALGTSFGLLTVSALATLGAYFSGDRQARRRILAFILLACAVYGLIALGRAAPYEMWKANLAESAQAHRYHYLSTAPLALLLSEVLAQAGKRARLPRGLPVTALAGGAALCVHTWTHGVWKLDERHAVRERTLADLAQIDAAIDSHPVGAHVRIPLDPVGYAPWGIFDYESAPGLAAVFAVAYPTDVVRGRTVHFIEPREKRGVFRDPKHLRFSRLIGA
jgi:hypothetical protein